MFRYKYWLSSPMINYTQSKLNFDKGKPIEKWGRKVTGLRFQTMTDGLPKRVGYVLEVHQSFLVGFLYALL
ncbi:hypothetical protein EDC24_1350 [Aquisalibacillus elongatus]|uniref:Uncharacterized protein n=1 Tax=Aquisalibacillus elongatus TaxID=485577 RepID=A0A3N5BB30_9BACI|nr:hypothetical protein EDC24_1350 [Aquisalibacillus elongatus]